MINRKVWHLNLSKQLNNMYFFDLGFTEENDFAYWFSLNHIKKEDRTEEQREQMRNYIKKAAERRQIQRKGCTIDERLLPATMYVTFEFDRTVILPDFFQINSGYLIMSKAFADVLLSCNLGKTKIIPIRFFDLVSQEYVNETTYYLLNVAEKYQYFLPDLTQPKPYFQFHQDGVDVYFPATTKAIHDNYVYSRQALSCPVDLWADPSLLGELYISDTLMKSLKQAGFTKIVNLWECQLADV